MQGNCMLSIVYPTNSDIAVYTREERELLGDMHKERIRISDAILVVDIDHYIGSSTQGLHRRDRKSTRLNSSHDV